MRLAVHMANCQLEQLGERTIPCAERAALKSCAAAMTDRAFQTYTEFFSHIDRCA